MSDDDRVAVDFERENVGDDAGSQTRSDAWREIPPLSGCAEESGAVPAGLDAIGRSRGSDLRIVIHETGVLDYEYDIGAVLRDLRRFAANPRRTEEQRMHL